MLNNSAELWHPSLLSSFIINKSNYRKSQKRDKKYSEVQSALYSLNHFCVRLEKLIQTEKHLPLIAFPNLTRWV